MTHEDLQQIEELLYRDCVHAIEAFAKTEDNKDVYAFMLEFHPEYIGRFAIGANTVSGFEQIKERYIRNGYPREQVEETGLHSLKWSQADFYHWCYQDLSLELAKIGQRCEDFLSEIHGTNEELYMEYINRYAQSVCKVMVKLLPHFEQFNRTDDFIAYTGTSDMSEEMMLQFMNVTVPEEKLTRLFPEAQAFFA